MAAAAAAALESSLLQGATDGGGVGCVDTPTGGGVASPSLLSGSQSPVADLVQTLDEPPTQDEVVEYAK
jgi:hypothetical protein